MQPDPTYKIIFAHRFMVEELMRWLVADVHGARELVDALDFSGMQRAQEQSVTSGAGGQHVYANDMVWRVPFHGRPEDDAGEGWLPLVVMLEFQSEVDVLMALRVRNYVDNFHMERRRGKEVGAGGRLAPVLPIVLYNGESRWTAVPRVIDLVTPGAPTAAGAVGLGATWRAAPLLAGDGYLLGLERGLAAERELLCRLAARKFGAGAAERLAGVLAQVGDTGRLAQVGDWIIDCTTGESLIARFGNGTGP